KALLDFYWDLAREAHGLAPILEDARPPFDLTAEFFDLRLLLTRRILKLPDLVRFPPNRLRKLLLLAIGALETVHHLRALDVQSFQKTCEQELRLLLFLFRCSR